MLKHNQRHGKPVKAYTPRAPLSVRISNARELEASQQTHCAVQATIEAREEDGQSDVEQKILAAITQVDGA